MYGVIYALDHQFRDIVLEERPSIQFEVALKKSDIKIEANKKDYIHA